MTKEKVLADAFDDLVRIGTKSNQEDYINYTLPVLCKYVNIENVDMLTKWLRSTNIQNSRYYRELWKLSSPLTIRGYKFRQQLAFLLDYIRIENTEMMQAVYAGTYPA